MKLFLDTEFTGLIQNTTLISLAIVDENDRTFYAEFTDYDQSQLNDWLKENVIAHLMLKEPGKEQLGAFTTAKGTRAFVAGSLNYWLSHYEETKVQFVADVLMYDWVLFAELFGGALNLPAFIDFIPLDFSTFLYCRGIDSHLSRIELLDSVERENLLKVCPFPVLHNALYDTYLLKMCFKKLEELTAR